MEDEVRTESFMGTEHPSQNNVWVPDTDITKQIFCKLHIVFLFLLPGEYATGLWCHSGLIETKWDNADFYHFYHKVRVLSIAGDFVNKIWNK